MREMHLPEPTVQSVSLVLLTASRAPAADLPEIACCPAAHIAARKIPVYTIGKKPAPECIQTRPRTAHLPTQAGRTPPAAIPLNYCPSSLPHLCRRGIQSHRAAPAE